MGANNTAVFTNLDPGKYTLLVKAGNPGGESTTEAATMPVCIKLLFWMTGYAYVFYVLVAVFIFWSVRHRGIGRLQPKFAAESYF
ncbi:triple tyrosine motif-containing protein [Foetidibacter luteolus]|uniref:triple tyrosine motif-containing protein n=1 Tax=Foetidibacter luteolus TaxID=2608880 RepID=UPI00129C08DD